MESTAANSNGFLRIPSAFHARFPRRPNRVRVQSACDRDGYGWDSGSGGSGSLVDENMSVLRRRIHDMPVAESGPDPLPFEWTEWEKRYYALGYREDVCGAAGLIQTVLMNTRPGVAVGLVGLVALSVPASVILVALALVDALRAVHLN